jgi:O-acetyl-ADP-ribose deacetylase (regulator of RNase III)
VTIDLPNGKSLQLMKDDITRVPVDAIVNAANSALRGGGGVDGAIHRAGGPSLMKELDKIRSQIGACPTGSAVVTHGGDLPAEWVFHAVGPIHRGGNQGEPEQLASVHRTCLKLAEDYDVLSISFPAVSTGVYGYPVEEAAAIAMREVFAHLRSPSRRPLRVVFVLFDDTTFDAFSRAADRQRAEDERVE